MRSFHAAFQPSSLWVATCLSRRVSCGPTPTKQKACLGTFSTSPKSLVAESWLRILVLEARSSHMLIDDNVTTGLACCPPLSEPSMLLQVRRAYSYSVRAMARTAKGAPCCLGTRTSREADDPQERHKRRIFPLLLYKVCWEPSGRNG